MQTHPRTISLVIPAYNEEKYLGACLSYALKNSRGRFLEIIVIDNASTDRTKEIAQGFPGVRVVSEPQKGLTRARQRGFLEARGDIIAYIDADTRIPQQWFDTVASEFEKHPDVVCLSGPYIFYDASKFHQMLTRFFWLIAQPAYWLVGYMVTGGNFAIRRDTLVRMQGFDTSIEFYGEDTNIGRRARAFGKVKFSATHSIYSSARRLEAQGWLKTGFIYIKNFISEVLLKRPTTKDYHDIR